MTVPKQLLCFYCVLSWMACIVGMSNAAVGLGVLLTPLALWFYFRH